MTESFERKSIYMGLKPYEERHASMFKGRDVEASELYRRIIQNDYVVCYAESGEGKTSLINAGVMPLLRRDDYLPITIKFTEDDYKNDEIDFDKCVISKINEEIAKRKDALDKDSKLRFALTEGIFWASCSQTKIKELDEQFKRTSAWWLLHTNSIHMLSIVLTPVIIFDQFEEVFENATSILWTKRFFTWLEELSADICPKHIKDIVDDSLDGGFTNLILPKQFKALFSLRNDSIGELDYWCMQQNFIPSLKNNRFCLKPLTYEGAKEVVRLLPDIAEERVDQILKSLLYFGSEDGDKLAESNLPAIPALLLSIVCDSQYKNKIDNIADQFDNNLIANPKNAVVDILSNFYDSVIEKCNISKVDCEKIESALVDEKGKRVRIKSTSDKLQEIDFDKKYKEILRSHRLIKISKINEDDYVELVHDSLCAVVNRHKEIREKEKIKEYEKKVRWKNKIIQGLITLSVLSAVVSGYFIYNGTFSRSEKEYYFQIAFDRDSTFEVDYPWEVSVELLQDSILKKCLVNKVKFPMRVARDKHDTLFFKIKESDINLIDTVKVKINAIASLCVSDTIGFDIKQLRRKPNQTFKVIAKQKEMQRLNIQIISGINDAAISNAFVIIDNTLKRTNDEGKCSFLVEKMTELSNKELLVIKKYYNDDPVQLHFSFDKDTTITLKLNLNQSEVDKYDQKLKRILELYKREVISDGSLPFSFYDKLQRDSIYKEYNELFPDLNISNGVEILSVLDDDDKSNYHLELVHKKDDKSDSYIVYGYQNVNDKEYYYVNGILTLTPDGDYQLKIESYDSVFNKIENSFKLNEDGKNKKIFRIVPNPYR